MVAQLALYLANGGSGVAGSVQGVGAGADVLTHGSHLSNATGVVGDGAVRIDGQTCECLQASP